MAIAARSQPQGLARINRSNPLTRGALAIISGAQDFNLVTGVPLTRGGSGFAKNPTPIGIPDSFSKNCYLETETLPAIGSGAFVEFWYGVPRSYTPAAGGTESAFVTGGSNADGFGISIAGTRGGIAATNWGVITNWPNDGIDSGEVLPLGVPTLIVRVRHADGVTHDLWRDGRRVKSVAWSSASIPAKKFIVGSFIEDTSYWSTSNDTILAGIIAADWAASQVRSFYANPWQLLESPSQTQFPRAAAATGTGANATPSGVSAASAIGSILAAGSANKSASGVSATSAVGTATASGSTVISGTASPAGVSVASAVGAATASGSTVVNATAAPSGVSAASAIGSSSASGQGRASPSGVSASSVVGVASASGQSIVYASPSGVSAGSAVGTASARGTAAAYPAGVQAAAAVGQAAGPINLSNLPQFYAFARMKLSPVYLSGGIMRPAQALQSAMNGSAMRYAQIRPSPVNVTSAMSAAPIFRTASLT